jgi:hypothetical protein
LLPKNISRHEITFLSSSEKSCLAFENELVGYPPAAGLPIQLFVQDKNHLNLYGICKMVWVSDKSDHGNLSGESMTTSIIEDALPDSSKLPAMQIIMRGFGFRIS